jgi:hypothetical protein
MYTEMKREARENKGDIALFLVFYSCSYPNPQKGDKLLLYGSCTTSLTLRKKTEVRKEYPKREAVRGGCKGRLNLFAKYYSHNVEKVR